MASSQESVPATTIKFSQIQKRDGTVAEFSLYKIADSIFKAAESVGGKDRVLATALSHEVVEQLNKDYSEGYLLATEKVQDLVERLLMEKGHLRTAKAYILTQHKKHEQVRSLRSDNLLF